MNLTSSNHTMLNPEIAPAWVSPPNKRGTLPILYSSVVLLILSVWTAIHLNIPPEGESAFRSWLRQIKWVIIALLAPEVVLYTAWQQFHHARLLCSNLNHIYYNEDHSKQPIGLGALDRELKEWHSANVGSSDIQGLLPAETKIRCAKETTQISNSPDQVHDGTREGSRKPWKPPTRFDMTYCYLSIMGGFMVDVSKFQSTQRYLTLNPKALVMLADHGENIYDSQSLDINKARKTAGLPVTLLEEHSMVHIICALLMYLFWFRKPKDIKSPLLLDIKNYDLLSYLFTSSDQAMTSQENRAQSYAPLVLDIESMAENEFCDEVFGKKIQQQEERVTYAQNDSQQEDTIELLPQRSETIPSAFKQCHIKPKMVSLTNNPESDPNSEDHPIGNGFDHYASPFLGQLPSLERYRSKYLVTRIPNFEITFDTASASSTEPRSINSRLIRWSLVILLGGYAGVHAGSISAHFPSKAEQLLWKISCYVLVAGTGFVTLVLILQEPFVKKIVIRRMRARRLNATNRTNTWAAKFENVYRMSSKSDWIYELSWSEWIRFLKGENTSPRTWVFVLLILVPNVLARLYLSIEALISLRRVPIGVYTESRLAQLIPHL